MAFFLANVEYVKLQHTRSYFGYKIALTLLSLFVELNADRKQYNSMKGKGLNRKSDLTFS